MYRRKIFAVLTISILLMGFSFDQKENHSLGGSEGSTVKSVAAPNNEFFFYQEVQKQFDTLPGQVKKIRNKQQRLDYVQKFVTHYSELRKSQRPESMRREVELDLLFEPLLVLTESKKVDNSSCQKWQHRLEADFEPSESGEITNPQLKKAQRVIASICD